MSVTLFACVLVFGVLLGWGGRAICADRSFTWQAHRYLDNEGGWYEGNCAEGCVGATVQSAALSHVAAAFAPSAPSARSAAPHLRVKRIEIFYGGT